MADHRLASLRARATAFLVAVVLACVVVVSPLQLPVMPGPGRASAAPALPLGTFLDTSGHWAESVIALLAAKGVVAGFGDGRFLPGDGLSRAQFAKLAVAGFEGSSTADLLYPFPPVFDDLEGHWARGWVAAARELGFVLGYDQRVFGPDDLMTRAQVATVLARAVGWGEAATALAGSGKADEVLGAFYDAGDVPGWAAGYLAVAVERGIIRGYADGTLGPNHGVTRAEAATLLARALDVSSLACDLAGEFVDVDGSGRILLRRVWGWPEGGTEESLLHVQTVPVTACFRNGRPTEPAGFVAGDRVMIVLGSPEQGDGIAPAVYVHALSWDVLGVLAAVDLEGPDGPVCSLRAGDGETIGLLCGPETEVFRHGRPATASDLFPGDRLYALLDPLTGRARYLDAVRPDVTGVILDAGSEGGRLFVLVGDPTEAGGPAGEDPDAHEPPVRVFFGPGAFVSLEGLPSTPEALGPGLNVVFAELDPSTNAAGYCEAWSADQAADAGGGYASTQPAAPGRTQEYLPASGSAAGMPLTGSGPGPSSSALPVLSLGTGFVPASGGRWSRTAQSDTVVAPASAVGVSVAATGAPELRAATGADGRGITIAVVDTGIDPSHPALRAGPDGQTKLVDWVDFTGEGAVETAFTSPSYLGIVATALGGVHVGYGLSASGVYRSGVIDEACLGPPNGRGIDLDGDGWMDSRFALILVDPLEPGKYDRVLIDTDRDLDMRDELELPAFRQSGAWTCFRDGEAPDVPGLGVVLCSVQPGGRSVGLGFDGNGHGTHVAAVAAGYDPGLSGLEVGMAPAGRIMALKTLAADGSGDWWAVKEAVAYAGAHGADIVVLAVESAGRPGGPVLQAYSEIADVARSFRLPVFVAAGNAGPGLLTSLSAPPDGLVVPVGGYISELMWSELYGEDVGIDTVWLYNASGPGEGGEVAPLLLAPAAAVSAVPMPLAPDGYELYEGTSMAVPHVAGAAALLLQLARQAGAGYDPVAVVRCLVWGARPLEGVSPAEQGFGVLDLPAAAGFLGRFGGAGRVTMHLGTDAEGEAIPREISVWDYTSWPLTAYSPSGRMIQAELKTRYGLLQPDRELLFLPGGLDRYVRLTTAPGITGDEEDLLELVFAIDPATGEPLGQLVAHIISSPQTLPPAGAKLALAGQSIRGTVTRRYFEVPGGTLSVDLRLSVPRDSSGVARGLVRGFVYGPGGYLVAETGLVGYGSSGYEGISLQNPPPGIWELVTWAAPEYSDEDGRSDFEWQVSGRVLGVGVDPERVEAQPRPGGSAIEIRVGLQLPPETPDTLVGAMGWTSGKGFVPWRALLEAGPGVPALWELPEVEAGVGLLEISAAAIGLEDVDLYVYRLQPQVPGQTGPTWVEAGRSTRAGGAAELVSVWDPLPGTYTAMAEIAGAAGPAGVSFEARRWANGWALLDEVAVPAGKPGDVSLELELPFPVGSAGEYTAVVVVREASSLRVLAAAEFVVDKGAPGLLAVMSPSLGWRQTGADAPPPAALVLSSDTLHGVDGNLLIGKRISRVLGGRVILDRPALGALAGAGFAVDAEVTTPGYSPWRGVLVPRGSGNGGLTAGDISGLPPFAPGPEEPPGLRAALRLKCTWQWRP